MKYKYCVGLVTIAGLITGNFIFQLVDLHNWSAAIKVSVYQAMGGLLAMASIYMNDK